MSMMGLMTRNVLKLRIKLEDVLMGMYLTEFIDVINAKVVKCWLIKMELVKMNVLKILRLNRKEKLKIVWFIRKIIKEMSYVIGVRTIITILYKIIHVIKLVKRFQDVESIMEMDLLVIAVRIVFMLERSLNMGLLLNVNNVLLSWGRILKGICYRWGY